MYIVHVYVTAPCVPYVWPSIFWRRVEKRNITTVPYVYTSFSSLFDNILDHGLSTCTTRLPPCVTIPTILSCACMPHFFICRWALWPLLLKSILEVVLAVWYHRVFLQSLVALQLFRVCVIGMLFVYRSLCNNVHGCNCVLHYLLGDCRKGWE